MNPWLKIALGAVLAAVIVRYAGRGTLLNSLMERPKRADVPVVHPEPPVEDQEKFDGEIAPGAPF